MAKSAVKQEEFSFPEGGIGNFYLEDDELEALERAETEEEFGTSGIANFQDVADRMASYGRFGDDAVAHVETGELIIPKALIDNNPKLRDSIFDHLRELGVEDPERYVVGSGANSINPDTGMPEFFFKAVGRAFKKGVKSLSKAAKKVTKTLKKAVKGVVKVAKKVAPIVLPIVGTAIFGPIYGAALGSGIATLIQGGSIGDAFKSALISGGTGALFAGASGALSGQGFFSSIGKAANPANLSAGFKSIGSALGGDFSGISMSNMTAGPASEGGTAYQDTRYMDMFGSSAPPTDVPSVKELATAPVQQTAAAPVQQTAAAPDVSYMDMFGSAPTAPQVSVDTATGTLTTPSGAMAQGPVIKQANLQTTTTPAAPTLNVPETPGFFESLKGAVTPGDDIGFVEGLQNAFLPSGPTATEIYQANQGRISLDMAKQLAAEAAPSLIRTYLPAAALAGGAAYAAGAFDTPPQEELDIDAIQGPTGSDLLEQDPTRYRLANYELRSAEGPYEVATQYAGLPGPRTYNPDPFGTARYRNMYRPIQAAAEGGEIFPRRVGGIMPDEGIPGKDSVRAMLMPGEFVMTTDAVRGLGNGNVRQGINNMYGMMRNLESRGRRMA
jgi:hypothetical protein